MTPLPSRETVAAAIATPATPISGNAERALLEAYASGRLVDREAIDYEPIARKMYERATTQWPSDWLGADQDFWLGEAKGAVDAALEEV